MLHHHAYADITQLLQHSIKHSPLYLLSDDFSVNFFYVQNTFCHTLQTQTCQIQWPNRTIQCLITAVVYSRCCSYRYQSAGFTQDFTPRMKTFIPERRRTWQPRSSHRCKSPESPASSAAADRTPATPSAPKNTESDCLWRTDRCV